MAREAVIVSYARTGLAKSSRGGFNMTPPMAMMAHAFKHAADRSGVDKAEIEDAFAGNVSNGVNLGRQSALLAGMPISTAGFTMNRYCASGLNAIAAAANYVRNDGADCVIAGGVESISLGGGGGARPDPQLAKMYPDIHMAMIDTADVVAERYKVSREASG